MVERFGTGSAGLDAVFGALADPTRRAILERLAGAPAADGLAVSELAAPFAMSLQAVAKHLAVLERAGLVARERRGRVTRCRLVPAAVDPTADAAAWIAAYRHHWEDRFDALDAYLARQGRAREGAPSSDASVGTMAGRRGGVAPTARPATPDRAARDKEGTRG